MTIRFITVVVLGALVSTATAQPAANVSAIQESPAYQAALDYLGQDYDRFVRELMQLTEIPAPPFAEEARAAVYLEMLRAAGLDDVEQDKIGNVMGVRRGVGGGPLVAVAAHLDTVFPPQTDVTVRREGTRLMAPGIGDDTTGLAAVLTVIRALNAASVSTTSDILFVGNVGEEGPGDLRGVKYLFREGAYRDRIAQFISVESGDQVTITNGALGSRRYRVIFRGPGGHSYGAFGLVNPAFAMAGAVQRCAAIQASQDPKTTLSVGIVRGGTSVNSIPFETSMDVDMRSESPEELDRLVEAFLIAMDLAVDQENTTRSVSQGSIELELQLIGDRPSGLTPVGAPIMQAAVAAARVFGIESMPRTSSTDANLPISLGIPAITIGRGGLGGRSHSLDEWVDVDPDPTVRGLRVVLTTILAVAGLAN